MKKIRFNKSYQVQAAGGEFYDAGQVVELSDESAWHFVKRGHAEYVEESAPKKAAASATASSK